MYTIHPFTHQGANSMLVSLRGTLLRLASLVIQLGGDIEACQGADGVHGGRLGGGQQWRRGDAATGWVHEDHIPHTFHTQVVLGRHQAVRGTTSANAPCTMMATTAAIRIVAGTRTTASTTVGGVAIAAGGFPCCCAGAVGGARRGVVSAMRGRRGGLHHQCAACPGAVAITAGDSDRLRRGSHCVQQR